MTTSEESTKRSWRERIMLIVGPTIQQLLLPAGAILLALLLGAVFILIIGKNPLTAYAALIQGAFGDIYSIGETLENTTPLILTGLAVAFAFTMMMTSVGTSLGPLITGFLQEALDDLKMALFLISFTSISLVIAGGTLRFREPRQPAES